MSKTRLLVLGVCAVLAFVSAGLADDGPTGAAATGFAGRQAAWEAHESLAKSALFDGLQWRSVGPVVMGGRVVDIETVPDEPYTFYVAYASGGLWKTSNNGVTFEPLFDEQPTLIMGDVAVDPSNPSTVWVGTGEVNSSRSSYGGMGIFRSDDAGSTWRYMGLGDTDRIARVLVDPRDSSRVLVASLGRLYTPGGERGIYLTEDGGASWDLALAGDEVTGFIDMVMDPSDPDVLYAASWERSRRSWEFVEGGPGSGIWKSEDGGRNWTRLEGGFPSGEHVGRIGLTVSASQPRTLYAALDNQAPLEEDEWDLGDSAINAKRLRDMTVAQFVEQDPEEIEDFIRNSDLDTSLDAKKLVKMLEAGEVTIADLLAELEDANADLFNADIQSVQVWRSDDAGATWRKTHDEPIRQVVYTYGYYFGLVRVSPTDPERLYLLGVPMITSADGGSTWESMQDPNVHVDYHAMWIDPNFSDRLFVGNDGGIDVSYDGGKTWLKMDAQPVGQFYAITVDDAEPFNIYGGLQDNGTYMGSSRTKWEQGQRWTRIGGGDGMQVQVDPRDRTRYVGFQFGYYQRTDPNGKRTQVRPRDKLKEPALRYNWQTPILLSPHNADILYFGANQLFRSMDRGETWDAISPDLSQSENRGNVPFGTLTTISESTHQFGLLWVGTDDGVVSLSVNGGADWSDRTAGLPADRWVSRVEASHHDKSVAHVALNGYRDDDDSAYVYRTEDLGATWTRISDGLPAEAVNVVREDPVNPKVLYVGTDRAVYVSLDKGSNWQVLGTELPPVPVHDLVVHPRDRELVAGTHGRSAYVLDVLPVQEMGEELMAEKAKVFPLENVKYQRNWRSRKSLWFHRPEYLPELKIPVWATTAGPGTLEVLDAEGRVLRRLEMDLGKGVSSFTWDLLLDQDLALEAEAARLAEQKAEEEKAAKAKKGQKAKSDGNEGKSTAGRLAENPWAEAVRLERQLYVTPGTYTVKLTAAGGEAETELVVDAAKPREPRMKKEPKIRGQKDE